jgi:hypothetical protein
MIFTCSAKNSAPDFHLKWNHTKRTSTNKSNFEYMAKKGVVVKEINEVLYLDIHEDTLRDYLARLPKDQHGWHRFRIDPYTSDYPTTAPVPPTHRLAYLPPRDANKLKIPTRLKNAG